MSSDPDVQSVTATKAGAADRSWRPLYAAGAASALLYVVLVVVPVTLVFAAPMPPTDGQAVLEYIAANKAVYLTELISFVGLGVPALVVFAAVAIVLKDVDKNLALVGGLFGVASETIALALGSSPQSLHSGLIVLSDSYRIASTDAQRTSLASAADALVAATNAVTWAGILTATAILILSWTMRRGIFGKGVAIAGVVTGGLGILIEALRPVIGPVYMIYGLLLPTWFALVGWRLFRLARR
jgi:hypothetical protein